MLLDVLLSVRALPRTGQWLVQAQSTEPTAIAAIDPLGDDDLAELIDVPADRRRWDEFLYSLSPGGAYLPGAATLRAVGAIIRRRLLGVLEITEHLAAVEARAVAERRKIRILLEIDEGVPVLSYLPIELAHDGARFVFKQPGRPSFRCSPHSDARNLRLGPCARVLIATAHADHEPQPDPATLHEHAAALAAAVRKAGFTPVLLPDASAESLKNALLGVEPIDLLYIACHGSEDADVAGRLHLRGGSLEGTELARWLEVMNERGRPLQAVLLCACSSAMPRQGDGTTGMAQWLVYPRRSVAALGFRGPVLVSWALRFTERIFERLGAGDPLEEAFAEARLQEKDHEPQWPLAVLYARRRDPDAVWMAGGLRSPLEAAAADRVLGPIAQVTDPLKSMSPPLLRQRLPRPPRSYFTGRKQPLGTLRTWVRRHGAALITVVEGDGGIGKTEVAIKLAHEVAARGRPVLWLERADLDVQGALAALISASNPAFQAPPGAREEDLVAVMRRELGAHYGLLVLDDIAERTAVERLTPGAGWRVLVTTRVHGLVPGVLGIELRPLDPAEALQLLSRVAWDAAEPPVAERPAAERLVEALGRLPLALELAGAMLRNRVTPEEYLQGLSLRQGQAASDRERVVEVLARSLADLEPADERAFLALGVLPPAGATGAMVARTLGEPEPGVVRRLDRLVRHHVISWSPETDRYGLHPLLRDEARDRLRRQSEAWAALHDGAAAAIEAVAEWVHAPIPAGHIDQSRGRWLEVQDIFDTLDASPWCDGAPGGERIAMALVFVNQHRFGRTLTDREGFQALAERLSRHQQDERRANVLHARGDLCRYRGDLEGAGQAYDAALVLYEAVGSRPGQANIFKVRGDLRRYRGDLEGAGQDYDAALALYEAVEDRLGQANVLQGRGDLRRYRVDLEGAGQDYDAALGFYKSVESRLGQANILKARGDLRYYRDDLEGARQDYDDALALFQAVEDRLGQASVLQSRGDLRLHRVDLEGAGQDYDAALALFQAAEFRQGQAHVLRARGNLRLHRVDLEGAGQDYDAALDLYKAIADRLGQANVRKSRGDLRLRRDDLEGAGQDYDAALALYQAVDDRLGQANILKARGNMELAREDLAAARTWYEQSLALYRAVQDSLGLGNTLAKLADVHAREGDVEGAVRYAEEAAKVAEASQNQYAADLAEQVLAWAHGQEVLT